MPNDEGEAMADGRPLGLRLCLDSLRLDICPTVVRI
jgi:hypothetical protein